jgi:lipoprotein-anchoring transpeptidase ErfK/SrfK
VCLIGAPAGQAVAQGEMPYPSRAVRPYEGAVPGFASRLPRRYYRVEPRYGEVVVVPPGRRVYLYDGPVRTYYVYPYARYRYPYARYAYPYARGYVRAVPRTYYSNESPLPRPQLEERYAGRIVPDEREVAPDDRQWRDRRTAVPSLEPDPRAPEEIEPRALPQLEPRAPARYSALPPRLDGSMQSPSRGELPARLRRQIVQYPSKEAAGTIVIDTAHTYLYYVNGDGTAVRYGIGVGRDGFTWSGREKVSRMAEWPDWYPPKEMIQRQPNLPRMMAGGPGNPLGARALYLGNTLYRIHGTNEPATIGRFVSSGCIRLLNEDIEDLYSRVRVGTKVVVLPGGRRQATARR